jgi:hypothetical protein
MPDNERDVGFIKRLAGLFSKAPREVPKKTTEPLPAKRSSDALVSWREMSDWYSDSMQNPSSRKTKYQLYKFLDDNLAEASTALNVYSDTMVSGTVGGEENYQVYVDKGTKNKDEIERVVKAFEKRTGIKDDVWDMSRDTIRDGDCFEEVVIEQNADEVYIAKLKDLPVDEMFANVDEKGTPRDPEVPYYQVPTSWGTTEKRVPFEWWRCVHFRVGRRVYGVDRSIFANASKRIGRQLVMIDDALVIARLSRAAMRYVFMIDVAGIPPDERFEYVQKFMNKIKTKEIVDRSKGRINILDAPWAPDDDIGIPTEPGINQDIKALSGDTNLGQIVDVHYFRDKFFGVLTIPKAYASIEEGTRSKATLTQLDVQFARQVRRKQAAMLPGLKKLYEIEFILHGIDPNSFEWDIEFPELATSDELAKWGIVQLKVGIARTLVMEIGCVNTDWVLYEVMGFDEEQVKKYGITSADLTQQQKQQDQDAAAAQAQADAAAAAAAQQQPGQPGQPQPPVVAQPVPLKQQTIYLSPDLRKKLLADPFLRSSLEDLKDIVQSRIDREKRIDGKVPVGISRTERLRDKWI